jgi:hypothetical protein
MPIYCEAKSANQGELFPECATPIIAGRNANTKAKKDMTLVLDYGWNIISTSSSHHSSSLFTMHLVVPAYQPTISAVFNVLNHKDEIERLQLSVLGGLAQRDQLIGLYTATDGQIVSANLVHSHDSSDSGGKLSIMMSFDKIIHDNKMTSTSGVISSTNLGA